MKILLMIPFFFALVSTGCNNSSEKSAATESVKDSVGSPLVDISTATGSKTLLCQNWENKEDAEDAALSGDSGGEGLELPYRGISFFEDATVVQNPRNEIRFGKWTLDETGKVINVVFDKGGKAQYTIETIGPKQLILMNNTEKKKMEYKADARIHANLSDDPFHGSNNQWRIKPGKPESDSAIKLRTEQCVLFYAKFLEDNGNRGSYSFVGLPTCFKWYRGGFTVTGKDKLQEKWLNCYYNKAQALKAHAMLESIISKKYIWDKEEKNWLKQSARVIKQVYDTLRLL